LFISLELDPEPVVKNAQGAIPITNNGLRQDRLNFLRHHADIGTVAAVIAETIVAETIRKITEQNDIVLEGDVGSSTTTTATTTTTEATTATTTEATTAAAEAAATDTRAATRR
jgi:hypothetical protein